MPKFQIYIGIAAIAIAGLLGSCQPNSTISKASDKSISYLRSQLNMSPNLAIVVESKKSNPANISDLCQTANPVQEGFAVTLVAEGMRYILQTNQDASKIEICRSEDAKPETTAKYVGAGYILRYPADWKAIDLGLEPSGASTVIFTPDRDISREINLKGEQNIEKLLQNLQQKQQVYAIVSRQSIDSDRRPKDDSETAKNMVIVPFDAKVKGAKSGTKKEFTTAIANNSNNLISWKVKVLDLETDRFIYTVRYYQPEAKDKNINAFEKVFEQFTNSFAIVQSQ